MSPIPSVIADLAADFSYSLRSLARRPGFTAVAVATLALGIGANTAIFSAVNTYLLQPPPFPQPDELVSINETTQDQDFPVSVPNYLDVKREARSFEGLAAYRWASFNLAGGDERPERIGANMASADVFDVLGVEMLMGRGFPPEAAWVDDGPDLEEAAALAAADAEGTGEGDAGAVAEATVDPEVASGEDEAPAAAAVPRVAVISEALWQRRFGGDPDVLGSTLRLDGEVYTVTGVVAESYELPWSDPIDLWVPLAIARESLGNRGSHSNTTLVGRLAPGVTPAAAEQELAALYDRLREIYPGTNTNVGVALTPLHERMVEDARAAVLILWGAVAFVLLIACANLANLLLTRAAGRRRELSVRRALGAGRGRLLRQLLAESTLLGLAGGLVGLLLAAWGIEMLRLTAPDSARAAAMTLDVPVLAFALVLSLGAGLAIGLVPALAITRRATAANLTEGGRGGGPDRSGARLRRVLVGAEVAMALVLLIGAGLMIDSFRILRGVDPGYRTEGVLVADVSLRGGAYGEAPNRVAFAEGLVRRVAARPGVTGAAIASPLPLMDSSSASSFYVEGQTFERGENPSFRWSEVTSDYFEVMDIPLLAGRPFADSDHAEAPPVIIVDRLTADRLWPGEDPLGRRMRSGQDDPWSTVVGVVPPIRHLDLDQPPKPHVYRPLAQRAPSEIYLVASTPGEPTDLSGAVREEVAALDPNLPLGEVVAMTERRQGDIEEYWYPMLLLGLFSLLAALLAALGIYGVMSYAVEQRVREIGVRMALGAARREVVGMVLGEGARVVAVGAAVGLAGGLVLSRLLAGLLYEVQPGDPWNLAAVTTVLGAVALGACLLPARRAASVDPMDALRWE